GHPADGHPPTTHEYDAGLRVLAKCLGPVADLEVTQVRAEGAWKEGPELIERADGVVLFVSEGARWLQNDPARLKAVRKVAARGAAARGHGDEGPRAGRGLRRPVRRLPRRPRPQVRRGRGQGRGSRPEASDPRRGQRLHGQGRVLLPTQGGQARRGDAALAG